jgi:hypothetical protein
MFGSKGWKGLHNQELRNLYASLNIVRVIKSGRMRLAGHVAHMGAMRNAYNILVGKPEGKRPLERPRRRGRMDLREAGWDRVDASGSRQGPMAGSCKHSNEH